MHRKGVTLLETILVITIIAIVAGLALPQLQKGADLKRADNAIAAMRTMSYCLRLYLQEHGGVLPSGAQWGYLDTENANGITGNGCFDRNQREQTFSFPARSAAIGNSTIISASDTKSSRIVCLAPSGTSDQGYVYDLPSGECNPLPSSGWHRKFPE